MEELESYALHHPRVEPAVLRFARHTLVELCNEGASESTGKYFQLRQSEAAGHVNDLQLALDQINELQRQRAELWRQAAHDLRGNLGIVKNVTHGLSQNGIPEPLHNEFLRLLQKSVAGLHTMLDEVIDLARLEAGQESRANTSFDATVLLKEICENLQPLAAERGLFLKTHGPATLMVEGDAGKVKRIIQNLLLNALKYTTEGGVTLSWGERPEDADHWLITVQDSGPGFHAGPGAPLAAALKQATREVHQDAGNPTSPDPPAPDTRPVHQEAGEGIGLSIVKRLCELLDATLELDSRAHQGTTFSVILPRCYQ
jgi:signal transduction histidine kinase